MKGSYLLSEVQLSTSQRRAVFLTTLRRLPQPFEKARFNPLH